MSKELVGIAERIAKTLRSEAAAMLGKGKCYAQLSFMLRDMADDLDKPRRQVMSESSDYYTVRADKVDYEMEVYNSVLGKGEAMEYFETGMSGWELKDGESWRDA